MTFCKNYSIYVTFTDSTRTGQFRGIHDLIFFEDSQNVLEFLISLGRRFHIVGLRYCNAFKP